MHLFKGRRGILIFDFEKAWFSGKQMVFEVTQPAGMGKITCAHQVYALDPGPGKKTGYIALFAGSPGKRGMYMKISYVRQGFKFLYFQFRFPFPGCGGGHGPGFKNN